MESLSDRESGPSTVHLLVQRRYWKSLEVLLNRLSQKEIVIVVGRKDQNGSTPIHLLPTIGVPKAIIQTIFSCISNENAFHLLLIQNQLGFTALHMAASKGHCQIASDILATLKDDALRRKLLSMQDTDGNTAFHLAALHGLDTFRRFTDLSYVSPHKQMLTIPNKLKVTPLELVSRHFMMNSIEPSPLQLPPSGKSLHGGDFRSRVEGIEIQKQSVKKYFNLCDQTVELQKIIDRQMEEKNYLINKINMMTAQRDRLLKERNLKMIQHLSEEQTAVAEHNIKDTAPTAGDRVDEA